MRVRNTQRATLMPIIHDNISKGATIMSDEYRSYNKIAGFYDHEVVNHGNGNYVIGNAHTNAIEGFWSLLKRGIIGIYHNVSEKHLEAYVDEFEYRYNTNKMACAEKFGNMLSLSESRITYKNLIA
jgi:transposase-like protein